MGLVACHYRDVFAEAFQIFDGIETCSPGLSPTTHWAGVIRLALFVWEAVLVPGTVAVPSQCLRLRSIRVALLVIAGIISRAPFVVAIGVYSFSLLHFFA